MSAHVGQLRRCKLCTMSSGGQDVFEIALCVLFISTRLMVVVLAMVMSVMPSNGIRPALAGSQTTWFELEWNAWQVMTNEGKVKPDEVTGDKEDLESLSDRATCRSLENVAARFINIVMLTIIDHDVGLFEDLDVLLVSQQALLLCWDRHVVGSWSGCRLAKIFALGPCFSNV